MLTVAQRTLEYFVPGGDKDPRLYKDAKGAIMIIGPDLPIGTQSHRNSKITSGGFQRSTKTIHNNS